MYNKYWILKLSIIQNRKQLQWHNNNNGTEMETILTRAIYRKMKHKYNQQNFTNT